MSSNASDAPKSTPARSPRIDRARLSVHETGDATEQAISQLVRAVYGAVSSLIPPAVARPTEAVSLVFDVLDQVVGAGRRLSLEVAELLESGIEGSAGHYSEQRAA